MTEVARVLNILDALGVLPLFNQRGASRSERSEVAVNALVGKLRRMAEDTALPIGEAWNALEEAADALEEAQACLCDAIAQDETWLRIAGVSHLDTDQTWINRWRKAAGMEPIANAAREPRGGAA